MCQYGVMPANGLIYAPAHACGCYMEAKLFGFWALAPERTQTVPAAKRLTPGPAFGRALAYESSSDLEWPTHRHDALRSGGTPATVSDGLETVRTVPVEGQISAPVVAEGAVFISAIDSHRVIAMDAEDGDVRWEFTAGGRIDSPPTVYRGLALFGSADGHVYCLRATDGELVWRLRAAPVDRRTVALDQVESIWPVHGSVLERDEDLRCDLPAAQS